MPFLTLDPTSISVAKRLQLTKYIGLFLGLSRDATKAEIETMMIEDLKKKVDAEQESERRRNPPPITPFDPV